MWVEAKRFGFRKKKNIQLVTKDFLLNRCCSSHQYIIKIKMKDFVYFAIYYVYLHLSVYIYLGIDAYKYTKNYKHTYKYTNNQQC